MRSGGGTVAAAREGDSRPWEMGPAAALREGAGEGGGAFKCLM